MDASLQRRERGRRLLLMAQRLSETDKAAAAPEKGDDMPASELKEKSSDQELARTSCHHPPGGVQGRGGGWNFHGEPGGASTPRGDNEMISTAAVKESEESNKGSSDRLDAEAEAISWKGKAEAAQSSYRQMMSQLQKSEQIRMKQAVEISSLREGKSALEETYDTLEKEKLKTQEILDRTLADASRLRDLLRLYQLPRHRLPPLANPETPQQHPHQPQPQSLRRFSTESPSRSILTYNRSSPHEEQKDTEETLAPASERRSSRLVGRSLVEEGAGAAAEEQELIPPAFRASTRGGWKKDRMRRSGSSYSSEEDAFRRGGHY